MPPKEHIYEALLWTVLPALATAAIVMALLTLRGGPKQAPAGAALGLLAGAVIGFWLRSDLLPLDAPGESAWNRLPWAVLAALCMGRVACMPELPIVDGWLLRGATAFGIAW